MATIGKGNKQISITLPEEIVEKLEKDAEIEVRDRSKQAAKIIIDYYRSKDNKQV